LSSGPRLRSSLVTLVLVLTAFAVAQALPADALALEGATSIVPKSLTVSKSPTDGGTVTATGIDCGSDCTAILDTTVLCIPSVTGQVCETLFPALTPLLTASPASGYAFERWSGCPVPAGATCLSFLLSQNETVTAIFRDILLPRITGVGPLPGAIGVSPSTNVAAKFSERMRASTISRRTFKLVRKGATTSVGATVAYDSARRRAILNPNNPLRRGATYRATVTTGVKDLAGNAMASNKAWSFRVRP